MRAAIVAHAIDLNELLAEVASSANGATVLFTGTVRAVNDGRAVSGIEYSAYIAMAEEVLQRIVAEAAARFATPHIVAVHRTGTLSLGETSVAVAVGHQRRAGAFEAARHVIEEIKRRLPVWKLEHYADGTREWVDPTHTAVPR